jgi:hypothetical protein
MSFLGTLGVKSREAHMLEGTPDEVQEKRRQYVREQRVESARRQSRWKEIEEVDVVPKMRFLVLASTDEIVTPYRGAAFDSGSAWPMADQTELYYYVRDDGDLAFFEKHTNPATWTEFLEKQAARERVKAAPKPRRVPAE